MLRRWLCRISGKDLIKLFLQNGWVILIQKGSHVIVGKGPLRETIPQHRELKKGLENALRKRLKKMKYHFKIHREGKGYWAQSIELVGVLTQGETYT